MAYEDENEDQDGLPHCTECGAEEFLNPETGLCLDCQLELEADEGDDDAEEEERECPECGEVLNVDGTCDNCLYEAEDPL